MGSNVNEESEGLSATLSAAADKLRNDCEVKINAMDDSQLNLSGLNKSGS